MGKARVNEPKNIPECFYGPKSRYESYNGIKDYFEKRVDEFSNQVALEFLSHTLSYQGLEKKANQLAHYLVENGVTRDSYVGIFMDRSIEMFVSIIGIFKAGGAYVPLSPEYPADRLSFLIEESETPVILTQGHLHERLLQSKLQKAKVICVDRDWESELSRYPSARLPSVNHPEDAAYLLYTSGSTGEPKGCINTQRALLNLLQWMDEKFPLTSSDKVLQKTVFTFDASVQEILSPLISGSTLVIAEPNGHRDPEYLVKAVCEKSITNIQLVPSMLQFFLEVNEIKECKNLKRVFVGGEMLTLQTVQRFYQRLPNTKLINLYGPTETAVDCTFWECSPEDKVIPIGFAAPNCNIYILDEARSPVPIGEFGELYVGGVQVGRGYWKRDTLTAERFIQDPFSDDLKAKMYKTGDSARYLENGAVECQGRLDFQVKVRGFRVELGEIEVALARHTNVSHAAVVLKKLHGPENPGSLVAYFSRKDKNIAMTSAELRTFLKKILPDYMVPGSYVQLDAIPLNTSGKVDRQGLMIRKD